MLLTGLPGSLPERASATGGSINKKGKQYHCILKLHSSVWASNIVEAFVRRQRPHTDPFLDNWMYCNCM